MTSKNMTPPRNSLPVVRSLLAGAGLLIALAATNVAQAQTPLIRYNFDEGSGTTAANTGSLGSAANLTLDFTGSHVGWASSGNALSGASALTMDGVTKASGAYAYGDGTTLNNAALTAFTITLWVNLTAAADADRLVSFYGGNLGFDLRLNTVTSGSASLNLTVDGLSNSSTGGNIVSVVGQWAFIAVSYDGALTSSNVSFYNGSSSVAATALGNKINVNGGPVGTPSNLTTALRIGSTGATNTDRVPAGSFDDVRIYSGVLDASQIEDIRASAIPEPSTAALMAAGSSLLAAVMIRRRR